MAAPSPIPPNPTSHSERPETSIPREYGSLRVAQSGQRERCTLHLCGVLLAGPGTNPGSWRAGLWEECLGVKKKGSKGLPLDTASWRSPLVPVPSLPCLFFPPRRQDPTAESESKVLSLKCLVLVVSLIFLE